MGPTGAPILIYPLGSRVPFPDNIIRRALNPVALALLHYLPLPNLPAPGYRLNYHRLTTQGTHINTLGGEYQRTFGDSRSSARKAAMTNNGSAPLPECRSSLQRRQCCHGYREPVPAAWRETTDGGIFIHRGVYRGQGQPNQQPYFTANRSDFEVKNDFTNGVDAATQVGLVGFDDGPVNANPFNFGVPNLVWSGFSAFSETQPASILTNSLALSTATAWLHGAHNLRWGGDIRRIRLDLFGGSNVTGTAIFTGAYSRQTGSNNDDQVTTSGSSLPISCKAILRNRRSKRLTRGRIRGRMPGKPLCAMTGERCRS